MSEIQHPSPEASKINPERFRSVRDSIQGLHDVLKEHGANLSDAELKKLASNFTPETDSYIRMVLDKIEQARNK